MSRGGVFGLIVGESKSEENQDFLAHSLTISLMDSTVLFDSMALYDGPRSF